MEGDLDRLAHLALDAELFIELTHEGGARVFSRLHLATGKLPRPREMRAGLSLREQDAASFDDDAGGHDDRRATGALLGKNGSLPFARLV